MSNADEDALRAMRAASPALQEWWPDGESPRSWSGVTWSDDRVQELRLRGSKLEVLPPQIGQLKALTELRLNGCPLKELPPEIGQLRALTRLVLNWCPLVELPPEFGQLQALTTLLLNGCEQLTLAPGAEKGQPVQTIVAAYAPLLIVEPSKDTPGQLHAFLLANPLAVPAFFKSILTDATHAAWLGEAVEATPSTAGFTDADGRRAIDVAHSACKLAMQAALFLLGRFDVDDGKLLHRSTTAAVAAATDQGDPEAKPAPRVALKAMREVEQVRAELEGRVGLDPKYIIAIKAVYADEEAVDAGAWDTVVSAAKALEGVVLQRVPGLSSSIQGHLFEPDARQPKQAGGLVRQATMSSLTPKHCFILVLELADRNLKHTIDHEQIAGKDWPAIRHISSDLGRALDHVHGKGGIHADFKPLNAVGDRDTWKIIDFDVFCKVGEPFGNKVPSSGYCPPEMARVLLRAMDDQGKVDGAKLAEYKASMAYDLWSFGAVLYHLCFGTPLWKTDTDDNIILNDLRKLAATPDVGPLRKALDRALYNGGRPSAPVDLAVATALLRKLLEPDAQKRLEHFESANTCMQGVLDEPFFQGQRLGAASQEEILTQVREFRVEQDKQTALLLSIKDLSSENKVELRRTREALMKGIFEATEVNTPTTFVVLNELLPALPTEEEKLQLMQIAEDGSGVTVSAEFGFVTFAEDGLSVEAAGECKEYVESFNTGMKWVNRLKTIGSKVAAGKVGDAFKTIKEGIADLVTGETMYLYLIDELTCEPVRAEGYPIVITKPSEIVHELLPMMQVGLRAMAIYNGAGGVARLFGYPVPKVPEAWATGARESVELLKQESSVAQFGVVHEEVMAGNEEGSEESKSVRGYSLRVFTDFLEKNDPGLSKGNSGHFAGLQRIGDPNDGTALWTTLTDPQQVKSALEARSIEREAELRDGNKYIQEQAAGGLAHQAGELEARAVKAELEAKEAREEVRAKAEAAERAVAKTTEAEVALVKAEAARDEAEKARGNSEAELKDIKLQMNSKAGCCSIF